MTISSSLNASVAGLNANATRLATISDNISNSSTFGYRRAEADFHSMVISGQDSGGYSAGGVRVSSMRMIDERGPLVSTSNPTDISIDGRGMFAVTEITAVAAADGNYPLRLMTTGSFRADADGILRTETGMVLMGWPANSDGTIPTYSRDTAAGLEPVRVNINQFSGDPTTEMTLGVNLPATWTMAGANGTTQDLSIEYFGNLGTSEVMDVTFTPTVPATGASNEWTMTVSDSASGGAVIGEYTLTFNAGRGTGGTLASVTTISGGAYDVTTGEIALTVGGGPMKLNIGVPGKSSGMTQLSDSFAPGQISKNGSPVANLTSVEVDAKGLLNAIYDEGFTRTIYQIPVVDVPNVNGLIALNDQTYQASRDSGPFFLWNAGEGPTGSVVGFSREESATDVAAELTQLIQTQRAYSSNAKVIQTVDEMLQETTNIKR
jgi:flagellar hook protein FlgE